MRVAPCRRVPALPSVLAPLAVVTVLASLAVACGGTDGPAAPTAPDEADDAASDGSDGVEGIESGPERGPRPATADADEYYDEQFLLANFGNFPSLDDPRLIPAETASWIAPDDIVMGVVGDDGEAHAYPVNQMAYHHIANTTLAGEPFLVTY